MSLTVLLVGGPRDGDLLAIPDERAYLPIAVYVPTKDVRAWLEEEDLSAAPNYEVKHYRPERIAFFGKKADRPVFVYEDEPDRGGALARHLLSPLGRQLVNHD